MLTTQTPESPDTAQGPCDVATVFLNALTARDFTTARSVLADDLAMRMLVPPGFMTDEGGDAAIGWFSSWFTDADPFQVEASSAEAVEGRAAVTYRLRLHRPNGWYLIEQHLMLDVGGDDRITAIDLLCSGFRSIADVESDAQSGLVHHYDAGDLGCADGLAGQFRQQIQRIPIGDLLVVSTSDPAAKEDLPSMARLMGHVVVSIEVPGDGRLFITVERGK
ncbi:sulfurtransferase TusA family protein [Nocardioides pocheonensis]|uniref:Sulfurtransferase TusA family protein n=1 Tax=Nocardioides pocheonensis TaxID=661485 RepID=A0A3N0GJE6_9ACTN|nr:sulfurtransferase TusA family protein [Nocardioides pocheonensis]RNM12238.1 sulfurtransferase TusA family protein [Nocardioides pocheonensis]